MNEFTTLTAISPSYLDRVGDKIVGTVSDPEFGAAIAVVAGVYAAAGAIIVLAVKGPAMVKATGSAIADAGNCVADSASRSFDYVAGMFRGTKAEVVEDKRFNFKGV